MSTKTISAYFKHPVQHCEFWLPGILTLFISLAYLWFNIYFHQERDSVISSIFGIVTGALVVFRTKLGTILYFYLIYSIARWHYEQKFENATILAFFQLVRHYLIFIWIGWMQLGYHFARHRSTRDGHPGTQDPHQKSS